jgi:hypothetical protein
VRADGAPPVSRPLRSCVLPRTKSLAGGRSRRSRSILTTSALAVRSSSRSISRRNRPSTFGRQDIAETSSATVGEDVRETRARSRSGAVGAPGPKPFLPKRRLEPSSAGS